MLSPFSCTTFGHQEDDDIDEFLSPCTTPRRSRKLSSNRSRDSKNPYANRGLDKFSALVAELEDKKQKIYTQKGSEDISFVRFVYSSSNNWRPIVVKTKDRKQENYASHVNNVKDKNSEAAQDKHTIEGSTAVSVNARQKEEPERKSIKWGFKLKNLRHPCCYLPLVMLMILLFLAMYGRSFAILCTSLGWYLVPMIKEKSSSSSSSEKTKNKKDYAEKKMVNVDGSSSPPRTSSPKSVLSGPAEKPNGRHSHRKSW